MQGGIYSQTRGGEGVKLSLGFSPRERELQYWDFFDVNNTTYRIIGKLTFVSLISGIESKYCIYGCNLQTLNIKK